MITEALTSSRYSKVLRMLDEERQLLLTGPLDKLHSLVTKREAAMNELLSSGVSLPEAFIVALKARADRNGRLLRASIDGMKSARAQIDQIARQSEELRTYKADGTEVRVISTQTTRDTRA
jgi:flagellar biosynthesis/type III secretory pathway chaperone